MFKNILKNIYLKELFLYSIMNNMKKKIMLEELLALKTINLLYFTSQINLIDSRSFNNKYH